MNKKLLVAPLALGLALAVGACNPAPKNSPTGTGGAAASTKPLVVDTVFVLKSADPARNYEPTGNIVARALYDTLVTFKGADLKTPVPSIASKWEQSADGLSWTFTLDPSAKFSDGSAVTADDVVFSLTRVENVKGNPSFLADGLTVTATNPQTVVVKTATYDPALLGKLASPSLGIVNSKAAKAAGASDAQDAATADTAEDAFAKASMGSGPYVLESFGLSTEVVLKANPNYWGATKPHYQRVVIRNVDAAQQKNNVEKGESALALDLSPDQVASVGSGVVSTSVPSQYTFYLFTNANPAVNTWTANPDFQEAVRRGIDYSGLLELAGKGSRRAAGMVPVQFAGSLPDDKAPTFDAAAAKAALAKSGYDGTPVEISFPSDLTQNGVSFTDMSTRIASDLNKIGIKTELKGAPVATVLELARGGKQQVGVWLWGPDFPDASNYLAFGPGGIVGGKRVNWKAGSDPALEAVMKQAATEKDETKRASLMEQFQEGLNAGPVMGLIQPAQVFLAADSLKNLSYNLVWSVNVAELG
ncbi:ABC transporter substrate-binding protein [Terrabacter aeriphilus]|uniref:ABC transporter substrate-binding protein n=1 Tax=Terrabacter aeriphilus TaxID=515662 RepID=A0ABP9JGP0_9MICO